MSGLTGHSRGMCGHILEIAPFSAITHFQFDFTWNNQVKLNEGVFKCSSLPSFQRKGNKLAHMTWLYCYLCHTLTATYSSWSCGPDHVTRICDVLSDNVNVGANICWGVNQPRPCRLTGLFNVYLTEWQMMLIKSSQVPNHVKDFKKSADRRELALLLCMSCLKVTWSNQLDYWFNQRLIVCWTANGKPIFTH